MYFRKILILFVFTFVSENPAHSQSVSCPAVRTTSGWLDLFPLPCKKRADCTPMGAKHLCCKGFCTKGVKTAAPIRTTEPSKSDASPPPDNLIPVIPLSSSTSTTSSTTTTTTTTTTPKPTTTTSTTTSPKPTTTTTSTPRPTTTTTTSTTTTPKPTTTTPRPSTEAPRPFLQILPIQTTQASAPKAVRATPQKVAKSSSSKLVCPKPGQATPQLFPLPCEKSSQCRASVGADQVCCERRCVRGVPAPRPSTPAPTHQPLLGVIPRDCPSEPLGELLFELQTCKSDADCWPRVCCPDGYKSYCRTAKARLDLVPVARQIDGPVRMIEKYVQCTAPPQYDLFPQTCSSSVDCFPNLCCAEGGKKHCRPPQRSLLALLAGVSQRFGSTIGNLRQAQANQNKV